jgi:Zn-dependent protease
MELISLLFSNPALFVILAVILLYSIIFHEVAHGWMAHRFGDDTALRYGRLTLRPTSHIDPIGTLMLFLVGFGWAKPVPVDYSSFSNRRFGLFSVALAGCAANILIATIAQFLLQFNFFKTNLVLSIALPIVVKINVILGGFNLIPIPPLDGSKILMSFLPIRAQEKLTRLEPYGFFILAFLLFTDALNPAIVFMENLIYTLINSLFVFFR